MNQHSYKKIAPILITVFLLLYYLLYFFLLLAYIPGIFKYLLGIIPALTGAGLIYVCWERIKEIDGGEEDDLSKY
ncbi:MAG: hypothetical protein K5889_00710 [Lachnospiraceae bacterium]|jgi:hypothetical protein|nr:hypothetical protein [Lachnospiraceae bacterium]SDW99121.1 hypothetical protein SAMN05216391_1303 [Lachnospiraceae bacterium KHCPX20]